jgi:hypothetical protein
VFFGFEKNKSPTTLLIEGHYRASNQVFGLGLQAPVKNIKVKNYNLLKL